MNGFLWTSWDKKFSSFSADAIILVSARSWVALSYIEDVAAIQSDCYDTLVLTVGLCELKSGANNSDAMGTWRAPDWHNLSEGDDDQYYDDDD